MGNYKKCPRCELNWIPNADEYCDVCNVELGKANIALIEEEDDETVTVTGQVEKLEVKDGKIYAVIGEHSIPVSSITQVE